MKIKVEKSIFLLLVISIILCSTAAAEEVIVTRSFSTVKPEANSEMSVTIHISGMDAGGIVETIPAGFSYISTSHPDDQTSLSGQNVIFSVIGDSEIKYRVKAPSSGGGLFSGVWYYPLDQTEGTVADTKVTVIFSSSKSSSFGTGANQLDISCDENSSIKNETAINEDEHITENTCASVEISDIDRDYDTERYGDENAQVSPSDELEVKNTPFFSSISLLSIIGLVAFRIRKSQSKK